MAIKEPRIFKVYYRMSDDLWSNKELLIEKLPKNKLFIEEFDEFYWEVCIKVGTFLTQEEFEIIETAMSNPDIIFDYVVKMEEE